MQTAVSRKHEYTLSDFSFMLCYHYKSIGQMVFLSDCQVARQCEIDRA
jgi:hypothetical protein